MDREAYLEFDRSSEEKHELWDGEVYAMTGGSFAHNWIVANLLEHLPISLRGSGCKALPSDMRVRIPQRGYVYPDVTIVCGTPELESEPDVLLNPRTVIEVLSPSTAAFDRGEKFDGYRTIVSVREVLFIRQDRRHIEHYARQEDGSWVLREYRDDDAVPLQPLPQPLPLSQIYDGVVFDER